MAAYEIKEQQSLKGYDEKFSITKELCTKEFDFVYDIIAALISLFDVITDIWILIDWYYADRMVFFGISLTILILANIGYVLVFHIRYGDPYKHNPITLCCCTCCLLPLAPFLSFTFYFLHNYGERNYSERVLYCFHIYKYKPKPGESKSREWMESKISKHIGFLMEAIMESFPQSILQMIAIMYFNEINMVAVISITISMFSVSSKSLIFSAATAISIKTMIFTWFYAVCDFFAIFFVLSFVFYTGDQINEHSIDILQHIWLYKVYIFTIPTCFLFSIPIFIWGVETVRYHMLYNFSCDGCGIVIGSILVIPLWAMGMILGTMILEILCYSYIAYIVYKLGHGRIPSTQAATTWIKIVNWIKYESKCYCINNTQDTLIKICCVNRELLLMKNNDDKLQQYLAEKEHSTQYGDVTYKSLKKLYSNIFIILFTRVRDIFYRIDWRGKIILILLVYYAISRIITMLFPILVIVVIIVNGQSIIYDLPTFQMIMLLVIIVMILLMMVIFGVVYNDEKIIFYILPLRRGLYAGIDDYLLTMIMSYYERLIIKPIIKYVLCDELGKDIGLTVFEFIPFQLEEEEHAIGLTAKGGQYTKEIKSTIITTVQKAIFRTYVL